MRFYDLQTKTITPKNGSLSTPSGMLPTISSNDHGVVRQWTSFPKGSYDAGALDIVFDLQIAPGNTPTGGTVISIHGVNIEDLYQTQNFHGAELSLYAGMLGGLPLSQDQPKPGLLINGTVFGAFGNWQGTEQTLDLLIVPSTYTPDNPGNIVFSWQPGQSFSNAITQALNIAYPESKVSVFVNPALSTDQYIGAFHATAQGLAHTIKSHTRHALGPNYPGVSIYFNGSQITVTDYSTSTAPTIALKFNDLVGQPTWLEPPTLTINTILRADIQPGNYITLPVGESQSPWNYQPGPGAVLTMPTTSGAVFANKLNFSGTFVVTAIRAVGHFRGTDDDAWLTVIQAIPVETIKPT